MTYKEILDKFIEISEGHNMVELVGYGDISDINTPDNEEPPVYPYVFINPINVSSGGKTSSINLNVICMTQTYDDQSSWILQQSNCLTILEDIIGKFSWSNDQTFDFIDISSPVIFTPFKERFSDDVVGMTAQITIEYDNLWTNCDRPIR